VGTRRGSCLSLPRRDDVGGGQRTGDLAVGDVRRRWRWRQACEEGCVRGIETGGLSREAADQDVAGSFGRGDHGRAWALCDETCVELEVMVVGLHGIMHREMYHRDVDD
jgi:hypothetical protein